MKEIKTTTYKGTRILLGNEKRDIVNRMISILVEQGFIEISIPVIQYQSLFTEKEIGKENLHLMFEFQDRAERNLCLAPEYTAVMMKLAKTEFLNQNDVKLLYVQECFRGEKPQAGRYRQFTQLGVEILNPTGDNLKLRKIEDFADILLTPWHANITSYEHLVERGLGYYKNGKGFQISCEELGGQKQICGGGEYEGGVGFAIGIDRLLLLK